MKDLIKKILKEEKGFKDSSEEEWEWAKDHKPTTLEVLQSVFDGTLGITADVFVDVDGVRGIKLLINNGTL